MPRKAGRLFQDDSSKTTEVTTTVAPWVPPEFSRTQFDFAAGTIVLITVLEYPNNRQKPLKGEVFKNPCDTGMGNCISLINLIDLSNGEKLGGHHTFFDDEIVSVIKYESPVPKYQKTFEITLETHEVANERDFQRVVGIVGGETDVGLFIQEAMETESGGGSRPFSHVLMNVNNVIIVISDKVVPEETLWRTLSEEVFANNRIQKIFFSLRAVAESLKRRNLPAVANKLDLQVLDTCIQDRKELCSKCSSGDAATRYNRGLVDLVKSYLPNYAVPSEMEWLTSTLNAVQLGQPLNIEIRKLLAVKVKYLLLLKQAMLKEFFKVFHAATEIKIRDKLASYELL